MRCFSLLTRSVIATCVVLLAGAEPQAQTGPRSNTASHAEFLRLRAEINRLDDAHRYQDALALARRVEEIARRAQGHDSEGVAYAISTQGYFLHKLTDIRAAAQRFEESLAIYERILPPGHGDIAKVVNNLGFAYTELDRLAEAEPLYHRALAMREAASPPDPAAIAESLNNLAQLYKKLPDKAAGAPGLLKRALDIRRTSLPEGDPLIAGSLQNLAIALEAQRDHAQAETYLREAIAIRRASQAPDHPEIAGALSRLAHNLFQQQRYADAERVFDQALAMRARSQPADHVDVAGTLQGRAVNRYYLDRFRDAEQDLRRTLAILGKWLPANHPVIGGAQSLLAEALLAQGRTGEALAAIREACTGTTGRGRIGLAGRRQLAALVEMTWQAKGGPGGGPGADTATLDETLRAVQWVAQSRISASVAKMATRFASEDDGLQALIRARDDLDLTLDRAEAALNDALAEQNGRSQADAAALRTSLAAFRREAEAKTRELKTRFPKYFTLIQPEPIGLAEIQRLLEAREALVVFLAGREEMFLWAVTRSRAIWRQLPISTTEAARIIGRLRAAMELDVADRFDLALAHDLYRALLGPAEALIAEADHLIVIPSGAITSLPLQVLLTKPPSGAARSSPKPGPPASQARTGQLFSPQAFRTAPWLIRRSAISVLPAVSNLRDLRALAGRSRAPRALLGFADPLFDPTGGASAPATPSRAVRGYAAYWSRGAVSAAMLRKLEALPGTKMELAAVAQAMHAPGGDQLYGADATETAVKAMDLQRYRILYFATHGLVAGDIDGLAEPALALTPPPAPEGGNDGLLTATEVLGLKLDADWVVLSACNTAAGGALGAEALSGLAQAFFYAGARALLVSHWRIEDVAAARLTTSVFQRLAQDPSMSRAEALRQAMLSLIESPDASENAYPAYWAPFSLVGAAR